ncbi:MAG: SocA family protein [Phycisphaeraceae bacterium]|nr:SocA family protein [Phycisphaeraceae bacterium]
MTQHDMVKLHVMIDFHHILKTGRPVIGGALTRWKHGPVVTPAYNRIASLGHMFDEKGEAREGGIRVVGKRKNSWLYDRFGVINEQDFSPVERDAMGQAWRDIIPLNFQRREDFFHKPAFFMGKAWSQAKADRQPISWLSIIEAYETQTGQPQPLAKTMIQLAGESARSAVSGGGDRAA